MRGWMALLWLLACGSGDPVATPVADVPEPVTDAPVADAPEPFADAPEPVADAPEPVADAPEVPRAHPGTVVFVGSEVGGVSGVWIADGTGVRCLTNCDLRTGQPWGDRYVAPPGNTATVRVSGTQVEWRTPDGEWETAPLEADR